MTKRARLAATLLLPVSLLMVVHLEAQEAAVPVEEVFLDNGMKMLLVERHASPTIAAGWVTHVGSVNETSGITGIAHLFEHMMFKGTHAVGTSDAEREAEIMDQLDAIREQMELEYTKLRDAKRSGEIDGSIYLPENRTPRLVELGEQLRGLQEAQRELIVKDEFDQIYQTQGGSGMNAGTSYDFTMYHITVPANKLELWFWMESERLLNPVFREFYSERDVVREERRMRVESDPTAKFEEQFDAMFWAAIPYSHTLGGWPSDVESISRQQADEFFATYYAPNNITAVLVGDFDRSRALELARQYLGRIPRGAMNPPEMITEEIEQLSERRMRAEADTNPSVHIRWHAVPFVHKDVYSLDVMSDVLSGRTGRLYESLVENANLATGEPYAYIGARKYAGLFEVGTEITDEATHEQVEAALLAEIERLKKEPVPERELQKVKNQSLANSFRRLQSNTALLMQLMIYDAYGNWEYLTKGPEKVQAVTADDIMAAANRYFPATGKNVMWYFRKQGTDEDPEVAALTGQAKTMAKQALAQIEQIDDPDELAEILSQLQTQAGQIPPEFKPALDLIIRRTKERITELGQPGEEG